LRIRAKNLRLGGAVSVPITVSAVSEKPVAARAFAEGCECVAPGPAVVEPTKAVTAATRPASVLIIENRGVLVIAP
jgi:hypothetical protein